MDYRWHETGRLILFFPYLQISNPVKTLSVVRILFLVRLLYPVWVFYNQSVVRRPQSTVHSWFYPFPDSARPSTVDHMLVLCFCRTQHVKGMRQQGLYTMLFGLLETRIVNDLWGCCLCVFVAIDHSASLANSTFTKRSHESKQKVSLKYSHNISFNKGHPTRI